jgi:NCAIR mutase (PurE)-related protein
VVAVNIDNGFGGASAALRILRRLDAGGAIAGSSPGR